MLFGARARHIALGRLVTRATSEMASAVVESRVVVLESSGERAVRGLVSKFSVLGHEGTRIVIRVYRVSGIPGVVLSS